MASTERYYRRIGTFKVVSGNIAVKDPCYDNDMGSTFPAKNGSWEAEVHTDGRIIYALIASIGSPSGVETEVCEEVVDSGQAGIFDSIMAGMTHDEDYDDICKITLSDGRAGIIKEFGVVSATAYGDGSYPVLVRRDPATGVVSSVRIDFDPVNDADYYDPDPLHNPEHHLSGSEADKDE
jgi:hypothetical protein